MSDIAMYGSMALIGAALALAGGIGVLLPPGHRAGVGFALLGFFISSIAGFATVATGLAVTWRRARSRPAG